MKNRISRDIGENNANRLFPILSIEKAVLVLVSWFFFSLPSVSSAHHANLPWPAPKTPAEAAARDKALKSVNEDYVKNIKPIFVKSCFDCHSDKTAYPWWYHVPGVKQYIQHDIAEGREHIDMSHDFPFGGTHGNPPSDILAIKKEVDDGDMPPWRYWLVHPDTKLNGRQTKIINAWADESLQKLGITPDEIKKAAAEKDDDDD